MVMSENRSWTAEAKSGGFNYRNKYQPFLSRKYYFEKRYFNRSERLSWSHHDSFIMMGFDLEPIHILSDLYGYLARCLGMEVIDAHAYFSYSGIEPQEAFLRHQQEKKGYFYGSVPLTQRISLEKGLKKICFIEHPLTVLVQNFKTTEEVSLADYLLNEENWEVFEMLAKNRNKGDCMIVRLEEFYDDPVKILVDTMLFLNGHEPFALVRDAAEDHFPSSVIDSFEKADSIPKIDNRLFQELWDKKQHLIEDLGYKEEGMSMLNTYDSISLQRMI